MSNVCTISAARSICAATPGMIKDGIGGECNWSLAVAV